MKNYENNAYFWQKLDTLYFSDTIEVLHKRGSSHPDLVNFIYPVDYGCLSDTKSALGSEPIYVYKGSMNSSVINAVIVAVDILSKDLTAKLLVSCTSSEEEEVLRFLNQTEFQKTVLIRRGNDVPTWSITD